MGLSSRAKFSRYTGKTKRGDLIFYTRLHHEIATALLAGLVREKRIRLADNDIGICLNLLKTVMNINVNYMFRKI